MRLSLPAPSARTSSPLLGSAASTAAALILALAGAPVASHVTAVLTDTIGRTWPFSLACGSDGCPRREAGPAYPPPPARGGAG